MKWMISQDGDLVIATVSCWREQTRIWAKGYDEVYETHIVAEYSTAEAAKAAMGDYRQFILANGDIFQWPKEEDL